MALVKCSRPAKDGPWHPVHCRHQGWARCWTWSCLQSGRRRSTASCSLCSLCAISTHISAQRVHRRQPPISGSNLTIWVSAISKKFCARLVIVVVLKDLHWVQSAGNSWSTAANEDSNTYEWRGIAQMTKIEVYNKQVHKARRWNIKLSITERFHDQGFDNGPL